MATTPEQSKQEQEEFAAAFGEDMQRATGKTEDEEFGLAQSVPTSEPTDAMNEAAGQSNVEDPGMQGDPAAAESGAAGGQAGTAPSVSITIDPDAEQSGSVDEEASMSPEELQSKRSWEGRLRAREKALEEREKAMGAKDQEVGAAGPEAGAAADTGTDVAAEAKMEGEPVAEEQAEQPESATSETVETVVEQVQSGQMSADEAMKTLSADFGEEFTKMLGVLIDSRAQEIAGRTADEKVGGVQKSLDGLVSDLVDQHATNHTEAISDAHPDYMDVAGSPEFKEYIDALPEQEREMATTIIERGTARQIVKLLSAFKNSKQEEPAEENPAMDDAEGVRSSSGGLALPAKPVQSEDYEAAWDQF